MFANFDSDGNFRSSLRKIQIDDKTKEFFANLEKVNNKPKSEKAWTNYLSNNFKEANEDLRLFIKNKEKAYETKDLETYTKYLKDQNKTLDLAVVKTRALSIVKNIGINALISGAMWLISKAITAYRDHIEKLKQVASEASKQSEESSKAAENLLTLKKQLDEGTKSTDELTSAFKEQLKQMGYTESQIDSLISKYGGLSGAMDKTTKEALKKARVDANTDVNTSSKLLVDSHNGGFTKDIIIDSIYTGDKKLDAGVKEILSGSAMSDGYGKYMPLDNSAQGLYSYYKALQEIVQLIQDTASDTNNDSLLDLGGFFSQTTYGDISEAISVLSEGAKAYEDAIGRLHNADAQIELANYLKTNSINSKEAFDNYIEGIKNSTDKSEEYKQVLISVANQAFPQFKDSANEAADGVNNLASTAKPLKDILDNLASLDEIYEKLSEGTKIDYSDIEWITDNYPKLLAYVGNETRLRQEVKKTIDEEKYAAQLALNEKLWASEEFCKGYYENHKSLMDSLGIVYDADAKLFKLKQDEKEVVVDGCTFQINSAFEIMGVELNGIYETDFINFSTFAQNKAIVGEDAAQRVRDAWAQAQSVADQAKNDSEILNLPLMSDDNKNKSSVYKGSDGNWYQHKVNSAGETGEYLITNESISSFLTSKHSTKMPSAYVPKSSSSKKGSGSKSSSNKDASKWEDPTDSIISDILLQAERLSKREEQINNQLDLIDTESDFSQVIRLTNDLISVRKDRVKELESAMSSYAREAQYIRDTNPYNEEEWFNDFGESTQAYIDYLNSISTATEQEKVKDVFSQLQKYKKAYIEAEKGMVEEQKSIVQEEKKLIEYETSLYEDQVNDIKHQISIREELGAVNDPLDIMDYEKIMSLAEARANELRQKGYDDNSEEIQKLQSDWLDAYKAIKEIRINDSEEYIKDSNLFGWKNGDSEVKAIKRKIDWYKQYYPNALKEIHQLERDLEEAKKNEKEQFISDLQDACNKEIEIEQNRIDKIKEANDFEMSMYSSKLKILESFHSIQTSIAEEQHNIDKELMASKTMSEYLDENTRKLLFNDDDYKALSEKLKDISKQSSDLQARYNRDILKATAQNIDEITNNYERQYEILMQQYEVEKAKLEVIKKQQQLNNVLNERNVLMYIGGQGWTWVANTQDVINAQNELADAQYGVNKIDDGTPNTNDEADYLKFKQRLESLSDSIQTENNNLEKQMQNHRDRLDRLVKQMEGEQQTVSDVLNSIAVSGGEYIHQVVNKCGSALETFYTKLTGDQLNYAYDPNINYKAIMDTLPKGSYLWEYLNKLRNAKIDAQNLSYEKYASGTSNAKSGLGLTGEDGVEYIISPKYGKLIPIKTPTMIGYDGHEKVFSNEQVQKLWEMSKGEIFGFPKFEGLNNNYTPQTIKSSDVITHDNRVYLNGVEIKGEDGAALADAIRRIVRIS